MVVVARRGEKKRISGTTAYVRPEGAIGSLRTIAPRFSSGSTPRHNHVMHDPVPVVPAEKRFRRPKSCQRCSCLRNAERFGAYHTGGGLGGGAWSCLVAPEDPLPLDHSWSKGRFDMCTCPDCWAHLEREEGLVKKLREHGSLPPASAP